MPKFQQPVFIAGMHPSAMHRRRSANATWAAGAAAAIPRKQLCHFWSLQVAEEDLRSRCEVWPAADYHRCNLSTQMACARHSRCSSRMLRGTLAEERGCQRRTLWYVGSSHLQQEPKPATTSAQLFRARAGGRPLTLWMGNPGRSSMASATWDMMRRSDMWGVVTPLQMQGAGKPCVSRHTRVSPTSPALPAASRRCERMHLTGSPAIALEHWLHRQEFGIAAWQLPRCLRRNKSGLRPRTLRARSLFAAFSAACELRRGKCSLPASCPVTGVPVALFAQAPAQQLPVEPGPGPREAAAPHAHTSLR